MSSDEKAREFLQDNGIDVDQLDQCPLGTPEEAVKQLGEMEDGERLDSIGELVGWLVGRGEIELQRYRKPIVESKLIGPGDWRSLASEAKKRRVVEIKTAIRSDCPYTAENGCLYLATPDGGQMLLARFIPEIVAQVIRDDGAEITTLIKIRVTRPGGQSVEVEVPAERLPQARRWAAQAIGASAVITPMSRDEAHVATAAQYLGDGQWTSQTTYAHTGWRSDIDGTWRFLTASGALGASGLDTSIAVDLGSEGLNLYSLADPDAVDADALVEAVRASVALLDVAPLTITAPLLGAAYRAPLPLLPETSAYVVGPSGSLKSALSATVLQHYGRRLDARHFPANWTFTGNALEAIANQLANVLLIIDDYAPQAADDPRKLATAADRIFRGAANSAGRGRLRPDGTRRPERPPRAQVAATGEDVPPGESLRARLTVATVDAGAINVRKLTEAQQHALSGVYELAMAGYVRYLAGRLDTDAEYVDGLREQIAERRAELARATAGHARVPEATAGLLTGFRQFFTFAVEVGAFTGDEATAQMDKVKAALVQVAAEQAVYGKGMSVAEIYIRALASALVGGSAHLADQETGREPEEPEKWGWEPQPMAYGTAYRPKGKCIGWVSRAGEVLLHPDVAYEVARDHAGRAAEPLATTKVTIHKRLKEGGHLASVGEADRPTVRRRIAGRNTRVLHVHAERITGESA
ncbi:hypothetical protein Sipo8835_39255 [Streptomyces ipomoeae]|uniref:DUF927 domain-containing protein n=1 Tax=Streptomyces ipomoeae TaxID=103232 RepID=A0AAE9AWW3_9ACTN|nr:hypothetical protein [Streptomyces ipomoeae]TQE19698.1 hypothetical protein Sipo8835_39255 [Streptomyces ipomoeae]